ncbi:hypothetical protein PsYK624_078750 [Phanerochaete sordida]|uniref:Uncharacterized protein n=1 Tax=Phanerochaete sordida TaxID=48140 RepID=A0A9P3GDA5_9APHY|nr:hypothetical protein PsYK624_078750 [Phanerochaete sordida]
MSVGEKSSSHLSLHSAGKTKYERMKRWAHGPSRRARWTRGFVYFCLPMLIVIAFGMSIGWSFRTPSLNTPPPVQFPGRQI